MEKVIQFIYSGETEFLPQEVSDLLEISKKVKRHALISRQEKHFLLILVQISMLEKVFDGKVE
jgi:hypothetical protein